MKSSRENEQSSGNRRLRVFVDANTIVSGLVFEGNEALLLKLGGIGACRLETTRHVIDEVSKVLGTKEFGLTQDEITALLSVVHSTVAVHAYLPKGELKNHMPRLNDKKDVHVLAVYEKLTCDILVTGDKELLKKVKRAKTTRQALEMLLGEK